MLIAGGLDLKLFDFKTPQIEITALADIPSGTGLGSSGSFTTALLKALHAHRRRHLNADKLAELACHVEIDRLKEPIGKQDQFTTSYPGINEFFFMKNGSVRVKKLNIKKNVIKKIKKNLVMYFTGYSRSSYKILQNQNKASKINDNEMLKNLHSVKELAKDFKDCLIKNNLDQYGLLMDEHWNLKKKRSRHMSNKRINYLYDYAKENGALGGKLIGAGGGGFLIFYTNNPTLLDARMELKGLYRTNFNIEYEGPKILAR